MGRVTGPRGAGSQPSVRFRDRLRPGQPVEPSDLILDASYHPDRRELRVGADLFATGGYPGSGVHATGGSAAVAEQQIGAGCWRGSEHPGANAAMAVAQSPAAQRTGDRRLHQHPPKVAKPRTSKNCDHGTKEGIAIATYPKSLSPLAKAFPPGDFIREELEERGWTQQGLADRMGRPLQTVNMIVNGHKAITADTASQLAKAFVSQRSTG